ncbi:hypothetical protein WA026_010721 [Henosepilachna vigintioctopunctata]|uniref:Mitochondrial carrier protein n=1 Tax=Henosepilachna vigintioctopunctata TaxID=420089 RepID=A0AAW1UQX4_9CUCU
MLFGIHCRSASQQLKKEGFKYLYRGLLPLVLQRTFQTSIMFGVFEGTRRYMRNNYNLSSRTSLVIAAAMTGMCESVLTPCERVQILLVDPNYYYRYKNTYDTVGKIISNYGVGEFYRGYIFILARNMVNTSVFFFLKYEVVPQLVPLDSPYYKLIQEFGVGAIVGATVTSITFPLNVVKIASQRWVGLESQDPIRIVKAVYRKRGKSIGRFYLGAYMNFGRGIVNWGLINVTYESMKTILDKL